MTIIDLWKVREDKKRVRREEEERLDDIFKKSKIIRRSPLSEKKGEEGEKEDQGAELSIGAEEGNTLRQILNEIKEMRGEMEKGRREAKEEIRNLEIKIGKLEEGWRTREMELEKRIEKLEKGMWQR